MVFITFVNNIDKSQKNHAILQSQKQQTTYCMILFILNTRKCKSKSEENRSEVPGSRHWTENDCKEM